jgi:putative CocE/NonD family hydrolase
MCSNSQRNYAEVSEDGPYDIENAKEYVVDIDSEQDGENIRIGIVRPDPETADDVPVIVRATPYVNDLKQASITKCDGVKRLTYNFVPHGYAVGVIPVRGTAGAGGCMTIFGPPERRDLDQAIDYLGEAEWSNGNVAMSGGSYDGTTPFEVAAMGNDHLQTIVPMSGVPNVHELMYRNGAPETRGVLVLNALYYQISLSTADNDVDTYATRASCTEYAQGGFAATYATTTGEKDPLGYWEARNLRPLVEKNYEGSIFYVQGLQDWNVDASQMYPWTERLEAVDDIEMRYMLGQFAHAYPDDGNWEPGTRRNDWADIALRWYDRELKGKDVDVGPDAYVQDSTGAWRAEQTWPPERAETERWYLQPGDSLSREPTDETGSATVAVDPDRHGAVFFPGGITDCEGCARFETEPLESEYRFAGEPDLDLTVTPTGPGGYLTAYLLAVDEAGNAERVGWGMLDLRYPDRGDSAEPVVPGLPLDISLPIEPLDARIPAGSKLVVLLHQGTMSGRVGGTAPHPIQVQTGGESASLVVETFEASPDEAAAPYPVADTAADASGERAIDRGLFTGGQTGRIEVTVEPTEPVTVRDTLPSAWEVVESDGTVRELDEVTHVELGEAPAGEATTFTYAVEAPVGRTASGQYRFGPLEVGAAGDSWQTLADTGEFAYVVGPDTTMLGTR